MTAQENIDHDLRMLIGDLQVQLVFARAQINDMQQQLVDLQQQLAAATPPAKTNGKGKHEQRDEKPDAAAQPV